MYTAGFLETPHAVIRMLADQKNIKKQINVLDEWSNKELFQELYHTLNQLTAEMLEKKVSGHFWVTTSLEVLSLFEASRNECNFHCVAGDHIALGTNEVAPMGIINRKWKIYYHPEIPVNQILVGAAENMNQREPRGVITIVNWPKEEEENGFNN